MHNFLQLKQSELKAENRTTRCDAIEKNNLVIGYYYLRMDGRFALGGSKPILADLKKNRGDILTLTPLPYFKMC